MRLLQGLEPRPRWVSFLGCLEGCLAHLGAEASPAWLYGASGHAFALNIHRELCPSGPHVWSGFGNLNGLGANIGCEIDSLGPFYREADPDYAAHKQEAWEWTRAAIDDGSPCVAYDLRWGEWYLLTGYDDVGYRYADWAGTEQGILRWQDLGDTGVVRMISLVRVGLCEPAPPEEAVYDALAFAVQFSGERPEPGSDYVPGLAGYDAWVKALISVGEDTHGASYNAQVWHECRAFATDFLIAAHACTGGAADREFLAAIGGYGIVAENLRRVADLFPVGGPPPDLDHAERIATACQCIRLARAAEEEAVEDLRRIAELL